MEKVTFILPIHKINDEIGKYSEKALRSVMEMEGSENNAIIIIGDETAVDRLYDTAETLKKEYSKNIEVSYIYEIDTDVFKLINKAAFNVTTKYMSVFEFDDVYKPKALNFLDRYSKDVTDASVYLFIEHLKDEANSGITTFVNEIVWASSFANEYGYIDSDCLEYYRDFNMTGAFIRTEDFISVGGLKPSLSIAAWYEFMLRLCKSGKKMYVIPKLGYEHTINRKDSFSVIKSEELTTEHAVWLIEKAVEECDYKDERPIEYKAKKDTKGNGK